MTINSLLASLQEQEPRTNKCGNTIYDMFDSTERYVVDCAEDFSDGWQQFDTNQDAPYFGFWTNKSKRLTLCYCEGDWSLVVCQDDAHYDAEIRDAIEFYTAAPFATVINSSGGVTRYFEDQSQHFIGAA